MPNRNLLFLPLALCALLAVTGTRPAFAQDTADTAVNVTMESFVELKATPSVTLTPTLADIVDNNYIDAESAITLTLRTNNFTGALISAAVRSDVDLANNVIAPSSFFLKGGSESSGMTGLGTDNTPIHDYTTITTNLPGGEFEIPLDLRVADLRDYPVKAGATTTYTNTLVFTAIAND